MVLALVAEDTRYSVVALLPGHDRPLLRPGAPLRLRLEGYPDGSLVLPIDEIGDQVIGPSEVRRYLGDTIADAVPVQGPVVIVRGRLPGPNFQADGRTFHLHDGMPGEAESRVRLESIVLIAVPGLKAFARGDR
jgi:membrane fusion protein (multidrug efflux system)